MEKRKRKGKVKLLCQAEIQQLFDRLAAAIEPRSELQHDTLLDLLVAVVLSAQSTDKAVNQVTAELWRHCRNAADYVALGVDALEKHLRRIGLYRNKARAIFGLCEQLLQDHGGQVPDTREELMKLPGVGRKTANVVLNVGFGQPTLAVDTHVFRVANRTGMVSEKTPEAVELALLPKIPPEHRLHAHHYLILHGRYTCKARVPACDQCVIAEICLTGIETSKHRQSAET